MTPKLFLNRLTQSDRDVIQQLFDLLQSLQTQYCIINDMAVNAYVEPVVSLDLNIVIAVDAMTEATEENSHQELSSQHQPGKHSLRFALSIANRRTLSSFYCPRLFAQRHGL